MRGSVWLGDMISQTSSVLMGACSQVKQSYRDGKTTKKGTSDHV